MANIKYKILLLAMLIFLGAGADSAKSFVASSSNYILQSDSINFGGGYSTSSSYRLQDTMGEIGTGILASSTMILSGGYQAMSLDVFISLSSPVSATMTPALSGIGGGISNGSASWNVKTDNPAGYELSVRADTSPAMAAGANYISDYAPSYSEADFAWNTPVTESRFGYTAEGTDLVAAFRDNGVACGTGNLDTENACWNGLSLVNRVLSRSSAPTLTGATTTIKFRAEIGSKKAQNAADYNATVIVTAITL